MYVFVSTYVHMCVCTCMCIHRYVLCSVLVHAAVYVGDYLYMLYVDVCWGHRCCMLVPPEHPPPPARPASPCSPGKALCGLQSCCSLSLLPQWAGSRPRSGGGSLLSGVTLLWVSSRGVTSLVDFSGRPWLLHGRIGWKWWHSPGAWSEAEVPSRCHLCPPALRL